MSVVTATFVGECRRCGRSIEQTRAVDVGKRNGICGLRLRCATCRATNYCLRQRQDGDLVTPPTDSPRWVMEGET